jgi:colanic acid biosynthesis glycosyl transferase WcaI
MQIRPRASHHRRSAALPDYGAANARSDFDSMNILFLADNFPPEHNAQASRVYERACYWVRWGHQVTVVTCSPNFPEGKVYPGYRNRWRQVEQIDGIRVVRVKTFIAPNAGTVLRIIDFLSFMVSSFVAGLFERRPDVLAATSPQFFVAVAGCVLAMVRRCPFVLEVSDLWPASIVAVGAMKQNVALRGLESVEMFLYRRAAVIVTLTASFKRNLVRRGVDERKVHVVINGVDLSRYAPRPRDPEFGRSRNLSDTDFVVGYVGTHGMAHALTNVLDAADLLRDQGIRFLFVGAGAEREKLIAEAERRRLHNVIFVPAQTKEMMPIVWSVCDVALVHLKNTPLFETVIPSKLFEAMGMGKPVLLASPEGEASCIIKREHNGLCVPAENPQQLATAVLSLKNSPALVSELSRRSFDAATQYSRERQAHHMMRLIETAKPGTKRQRHAPSIN